MTAGTNCAAASEVNMERIKVLIVDDHQLIRKGLRDILTTDQSIEIVGEAGNGLEAMTMVAEKEPNVVLMDISMPIMNGIEATRQIKEKYPSIAVIILTLHDSNAYVVDAIQAGASGYLLKDASEELLLHTIRRSVLEG